MDKLGFPNNNHKTPTTVGIPKNIPNTKNTQTSNTTAQANVVQTKVSNQRLDHKTDANRRTQLQITTAKIEEPVTPNKSSNVKSSKATIPTERKPSFWERLFGSNQQTTSSDKSSSSKRFGNRGMSVNNSNKQTNSAENKAPSFWQRLFGGTTKSETTPNKQNSGPSFWQRLFGKSENLTNGSKLSKVTDTKGTTSISEAIKVLSMSDHTRGLLTTLQAYEGMKYELYTGADNKTDCYRLPHQVGEDLGPTHPLYDFFKYNRRYSGEKNDDKRNIVSYSHANELSFPEGIKFNQLKNQDGSLKLKPGCYMVGVRGGGHVVLITAFKSGDYIMTDASQSYGKVVTRKNEQVDNYFKGKAGQYNLQIIPINEDAILARNQTLKSIGMA